MDVKWQKITEYNENDTYVGARLELEATIFCTKQDFAEQLRLGKMEELRMDMVHNVYATENFLRVIDKTLACFMQEIKRLQNQCQQSTTPLPPDRFRGYSLN